MTQTALVLQNSFGYIYPEDVPAAEHLFKLKIGGSRAPFRFKLRRKDGTPVWVHVQASPMFNAEGRFTGIVGTFTVANAETVGTEFQDVSRPGCTWAFNVDGLALPRTRRW